MLTQSLQHLTTIPQCDAALKQAYLEQKTLMWKKMGLELQIERRIAAMEAIATALNRQKRDLETAGRLADPHTVQEGYSAAEQALSFKVALLEIRRKKLKPEWLAGKELRLQCIEASLEKVSLAVLELEAHKAGLQQQAAQAAAETDAVPEVPVVIPLVKTPPVATPQKKWPGAMIVAAGGYPRPGYHFAGNYDGQITNIISNRNAVKGEIP